MNGKMGSEAGFHRGASWLVDGIAIENSLSTSQELYACVPLSRNVPVPNKTSSDVPKPGYQCGMWDHYAFQVISNRSNSPTKSVPCCVQLKGYHKGLYCVYQISNSQPLPAIRYQQVSEIIKVK